MEVKQQPKRGNLRLTSKGLNIGRKVVLKSEQLVCYPAKKNGEKVFLCEQSEEKPLVKELQKLDAEGEAIEDSLDE